jgi:hypothetical protein
MPSITKLVLLRHAKCISMICILLPLRHCTDHCVEQAAVLFILTCYVSLPQITDKPILIYPNSGERYDGEKKEWVVSSSGTLKLILIAAIFFGT